MEISYIGHSCFRVKGKDVTLVVDPYDPKSTGYKMPKQTADVVLISHDHEDHNYAKGVSDQRLVVDTPGEYEISDVFILGIETFHDKSSGGSRGRNLIFLVEMDGISILHLGDLGHELSKETLEKISDVDILFIPVGGTFTMDAEVAAKVISSLEPGIVIPMHYQTADLTKIKLDKLEKFLDEMGIEENVKKVEKLKVSSMTDIPEDTEVVVLKPSH